MKKTDAWLRGLIREAALDSFSLEELGNISSFRGRVSYCRTHLGNPIGRGSGRVVFQIDDERVLKLAYNEKGVEQNVVEGRDDYYKEQWGIFPKVFEKPDDFSWMVCEYVLPAKQADFKHCLSMTFKKFVSFIIACYLERNRPKNSFLPSLAMKQDEFKSYCENSEYLEHLYEYMVEYNVPYGDMTRLSSYGLAMRDGKPTIVILDSGLDYYVYDKFYKRQIFNI